jgi:acetyl-CoA synthetase
VNNAACGGHTSCTMAAGDAAAVYMPMSVESVVAYLGTILAGCAAVTIADSFAPREIAARLRIARCKAIFTQVAAFIVRCALNV